jgi:acetoin utilization deacetylase AcuC-like enzyme
MIAVYTPHHILHNPPKEFISNEVVAYGESPERAELIFEALQQQAGFALQRAEIFDLAHLRKIHANHYLEYLQTAYQEWINAGLWEEGILPEFFALGSSRDQAPAVGPVGKAGFYMTDSCSMIVKDTWEAVKFSAFTALTGARLILGGEASVFSLCRPPGHHAGFDFAGGYCFVNNAALAAKFLQDQGENTSVSRTRVGILDLDFHHGNGTQDVVQRLNDILLVSIHGDPAYSYPYLTGFETENSAKNINYPLPPGIDDKRYLDTVKMALKDMKSFGIAYLVVSLGVDTFEHDQLGNFKLTSGIYERIARLIIESLGIPVLIIMEGGYNIDHLAGNVISFLIPFAGSSQLP